MRIKEMEALTEHFNFYFEQDDPMVLHPIVDNGPHIDVLIYKPTEKYPFWKLATMGASDYKMPNVKNSLGRNNEYIMFIDKDEDLSDREIASWYHNKLLTVATFAYYNKTFISYGHSFEWENEDKSDEMVGAFIEFPQVIENTGILRCNINIFKTVICLQVVLLNRSEVEKLKKIGPQAFSEYLYPDNENEPHFLSERQRSEKF